MNRIRRIWQRLTTSNIPFGNPSILGSAKDVAVLLVKAAALIGIAWLFLGCGFPEQCYFNHYSNYSNYTVSVEGETPAGIAYDSTGHALDAAEVDRRVDAVEACLTKLYPDGVLPESVRQAGSCLWAKLRFGTTVKRQCLTVKIAPDWHWSCDGKQQVFSCNAPEAGCLAKGRVPTPECPCCWRGLVQDETTLVTTPDLHLLTADLIRVVTSCNNIWVPGLQECYVP